MEYAHRLAWTEKRGPVPAGMKVLHTCDKPGCVQNDDAGVYLLNDTEHPRQGHLWLGTQQDNMDDMMSKGRSTKGRNGSLVLNEEKVAEARRRHTAGESQKSLRLEYGVSHAAMNDALHGYTWSHVK